jgi:hypothetical protein
MKSTVAKMERELEQLELFLSRVPARALTFEHLRTVLQEVAKFRASLKVPLDILFGDLAEEYASLLRGFGIFEESDADPWIVGRA